MGPKHSSTRGGRTVRTNRTALVVALVAVVLWSLAIGHTAVAQSQPATGQSTSAPPTEVTWGGYVASGSIEAGYRFTDIEGAKFACSTSAGPSTCNYGGMYNTLEDLHSGPRLLEQTLS